MFHADRRTDRRTEMIKLIVDFRNFAKAPKNLKLKIHRTIILPVILYGCETWSLTLREKPRVRDFDNRVLRRTFVPKRDGVTGVENAT